jgi:predicted regulator of Ras-like GTPase activity (Roadblock/LC7/MglB family)
VRKIFKVPNKNNLEEKIENLQGNLANIKTREGVIGYILRNQKSASVDIEDPSKMIDYAILSSTVLDSGEYMTTTFELGKVNHILVEGEDVKVLLLTIGDQRISVFMNKKVDHNAIYEDLHLK